VLAENISAEKIMPKYYFLGIPEGEHFYGSLYIIKDVYRDIHIKQDHPLLCERRILSLMGEILHFEIPRENPFYNHKFERTRVYEEAEVGLKKIREELFNGVTIKNFSQKVVKACNQYDAILQPFFTQYENAKALITKTEESFEKILAEVEQNFVRTKISQVREKIQKTWDDLQNTNFESVSEHCESISKIISSLAGLASVRKQEKVKAETSWNEIQNDLYDLQYGDNDFWMAGQEVRDRASELICSINSAMNNMEYEKVLELAPRAENLIKISRPSEGQRELFNKIQELQWQLENIENERNRSGRVEVLWKSESGPKGAQLQAEGYFTGQVQNRKDENGFSDYENKKSIFICRENCSWLEVQPQAGERWICTIAFQISVKDNKPLIVVNPQLRSDSQESIKVELEILCERYEGDAEID